MPRAVSERAVVLLIAAVQFINVLEYVMVSPLGPDFSQALGMAPDLLGSITGSYSGAAAVSGLLGAFLLDRFDRRTALVVSMAGLMLGTLAGGLATGLGTLMGARLLAGVFGGPATALSYSIVADMVPPERRGRAMGTVMSAFSVASILGVPLALELALRGGWRAPFLVVAAMGLLVVVGAAVLLPPMRGHLAQGAQAGAPVSFRALLRRPEVLTSYGVVATSMTAGFLVIPMLPVYLQGNLGFPRALYGLVPLVGGVVSFLTLRAAGRLVDRFGSFRVGLVGGGLLVLAQAAAFVRFDAVQAALGGLGAGLEGVRLGGAVRLGVTLSHTRVLVPALLVFVVFYLALGSRNVANTTLTSKVPQGPERARFMSLQSSVQHVFTALGSFTASALLVELPGGGVAGMERVAGLSMGLSLLVPALLWALEGRLRAGRRAAPAEAARLLSSPREGG